MSASFLRQLFSHNKKQLLSVFLSVAVIAVVLFSSWWNTEKESIAVSRDRLIERELLEYHHRSLRLTSKGESLLRRLELGNIKMLKPKRWDGKWRVLAFDIPEKQKYLRERIRGILVMIGFVRLQDSVWIYPYDCEDIIRLFKTDLKIGKNMLYMIVESLEHDFFLKIHFFGKTRIT